MWISRALLARIALSSALVSYAGLHAYVAERMILAPGWPLLPRAGGIGALALLALSVPLRVAARRPRPSWVHWLGRPGYLWLGFGFLLVVALAASDLLRALVPGEVSGAAGQGGARLQAVLAGSVSAGAALLAWLQARRGPRLARVEVRIADWPAALDGFRIAQISDLHIGSQLGRSFAADVVAQVNALGADLIAITGDLVDGRLEDLASEVDPFKELRAPRGVFFVTGNHDHYSGEQRWVGHLQQLGIRALRNQHVAVGDAGAQFVLAGVDDHRGGFGGSSEDLPRALAGRPPALPVVLLAHDPNSFAQASRRGVALQLSGHTHGGQLWPFRYLVRLTTRWVAGLYREGDAQIYVSRGTGFWGPPMRLGAPAEITEITLRSGASAAARAPDRS